MVRNFVHIKLMKRIAVPTNSHGFVLSYRPTYLISEFNLSTVFYVDIIKIQLIQKPWFIVIYR
jgi:hypothetical protein